MVKNNNDYIHVTRNHSGKMKGMWSISTSCKENPLCQERAKLKGSICEKCYASALLSFRKSMADCFKTNTKRLTTEIISEDKLPDIYNKYGRLEAFGDIQNSTQVINYFNICNKNKEVKFALWTKNPPFIKRVITHGYKKPDNLTIVYSSPFVNKTVGKEMILSLYPFIDHVFTVFDKSYIKENNVAINCGARNCFKCNLCYHHDTEFYINEQLK